MKHIVGIAYFISITACEKADMFPITNKGYLLGDIVIHSLFSSHVETVVLLECRENIGN